MLEVGDKFKLIDLDADNLRNIHYSSEDIDYIFDHLEEHGFFTVTRIYDGRGGDSRKIYYYNNNAGGECFFDSWMCKSLQKEREKRFPRGHCLTKMFK